MVGALGLRLGQFSGNRPIHAAFGPCTCILLGDAAIRGGLEKPPQGFLNPIRSGEARRHLDRVPLKLPEPGAVEAACGEGPGKGVAGFDAKVLEVRDHGCDRPFDKRPAFGGNLQLGPGDLPKSVVLLGHWVRKQELVQSTPMLQDHRAERVAAITFS